MNDAVALEGSSGLLRSPLANQPTGFIVLVELKKEAFNVRETQVIAEILTASGSSNIPVLGIATDLNDTYSLYWLEKDEVAC